MFELEISIWTHDNYPLFRKYFFPSFGHWRVLEVIVMSALVSILWHPNATKKPWLFGEITDYCSAIGWVNESGATGVRKQSLGCSLRTQEWTWKDLTLTKNGTIQASKRITTAMGWS